MSRPSRRLLQDSLVLILGSLALVAVGTLSMYGCRNDGKDPTSPDVNPLGVIIEQPTADRLCIRPGDSIYFAAEPTPNPDFPVEWNFGGVSVGSGLDRLKEPGLIEFPNAGVFTISCTVSDGTETAESRDVVVYVREDCADSTAVILSPEEGAIFPESSLIEFEGTAIVSTLGFELQWNLDGSAWDQRPGPEWFRSVLEPGNHTVVLEAWDDVGVAVKPDTVHIQVLPAGSGETLTSPLGTAFGIADAPLDFAGQNRSVEFSLVAAENGFFAYDWKHDEWVWTTNFAFGTARDIVPLSPSLSRGTHGDAVFVFGDAGAWLSSWESGSASWSTPVLIESAPVRGARPVGNTANANGLVYATPDSIKELNYDAASGGFEVAAASITAADLPGASGAFVAAARRNAGGPILVLTDGAPGELWVYDPSQGGTAERKATLGDAPHDLRMRAILYAVSNRGSNTVSLGSWTNTGVFPKAPLPVGQSPMGLDIEYTSSSTLGIACANYGDNTCSVILWDNVTNTHVSTVTVPLPSGCAGPVDVMWTYTPELRLAVVCKDSKNIALVDPGL